MQKQFCTAFLMLDETLTFLTENSIITLPPNGSEAHITLLTAIRQWVAVVKGALTVCESAHC